MIINVKPDEFADIVIAYLNDMTHDKNALPDNERFRDFIKSLPALKTQSYKHFLDMNSDTRIKYKFMKKSVHGDGGSSSSRIEISNGSTDYINEDFDRELCKKIFRKVKDVRWNEPSKPITEERLDKIIDYCIEKEKNNG
jgi:hypothetical protein